MIEEKTNMFRKVIPRSIRPDDIEEDQLLLERAKRGDHDAFGFLTQPYLGKLFKSILNITKNREDAEDSMQKALIRAFTHLQQFRGASRFSTWLVSIGVNQALMCLRSRRRKMISLDTGEQPGCTAPSLYLPETRMNPEEQCQNRELGDSLRRAINKLPSTFRTVFELRYVHEFSDAQAAMALGISIPAVKTRALRARRLMRQRLTGWKENGSAARTRSGYRSRLAAAKEASAFTS